MAQSPSGSRPTLARSEREQLCDLFLERGPLAPTLCEGWAAADLAAHLYVRENQPWNAIGIVVPPLASLPQNAMDKAKGSIGFEGLVAKIRSGPSPIFRPLDAQVNTVEYFVHHEDLRRAATPSPGPRADPDLDAAMWAAVKRSARLLTRKVRVGLELVAPGLGATTARSGSPAATVTGGPQELILYLFGRRDAAMVEITGPDEAVAALESAGLGL